VDVRKDGVLVNGLLDVLRNGSVEELMYGFVGMIYIIIFYVILYGMCIF
jgi:hypothetical protein